MTRFFEIFFLKNGRGTKIGDFYKIYSNENFVKKKKIRYHDLLSKKKMDSLFQIGEWRMKNKKRLNKEKKRKNQINVRKNRVIIKYTILCGLERIINER